MPVTAKLRPGVSTGSAMSMRVAAPWARAAMASAMTAVSGPPAAKALLVAAATGRR